MKKALLTLAAGVLFAASASAATVYFDNTGTGWDKVYAYSWQPDLMEELSEVTVDGHALYSVELDNAMVIFRGATSWGDALQTADLNVVDGAVYGVDNLKSKGGSTDAIAKIVDGKYVANVVVPSEFPEMYLVGAVSGWSKNSNYQMTTTDGVTYSLETTLEAGSEFKFFGGAWGVRELTGAQGLEYGTYTFGPGAGNATLAKSGKVSITLVQSNNFGSAQVTFKGEGGEEPEPIDPPVVDPEEKPVMYLVGAVNGWKADDNYLMTTTDGVTYTLETELEAGSEFKFFGGAWGTRELTGAQDLEYGTYTFGPGAGNATLAKSGKVSITLVQSNNFASAQVTFKGEGEEPEPIDPPVVDPEDYPTLYFVGGQTSWGDGAVAPEFTFAREGNVYTLVLEGGITGNWKIFDGTWDYNFGAGASQPELNVECALAFDGGDITLKTEGKTTITFTLNVAEKTGVVLVEAEAVVPPVEEPTLYFVGGQTSWGDGAVAPEFTFAREGNVYTLVLENGISDEWKIFDGTWDFTFGAGAVQPELDKEGEAWFGSSSNFTLTNEGGTKITFTYNKNTSEPSTIVVSKTQNSAEFTAVDAQEEVKFFNLQGVEVANPAEGIFIEVRGNVARKVIR